MLLNGFVIRINDIFIVSILFLFYATGITNFSGNLYICALLAVITLLYCHSRTIVSQRIKVAGVLIFVLGIANAVFVGNMTTNILLFTLCAYVFSVAFVYLEFNENILLWSCILFCIYVVVAVFENRSTDDILAIASNNYLSVYILIPATIFCFKQYQQNKEISVIPVLCTLIVSFLGNGRSGIISSLVFMVAYLIVTKGKTRYLYLFTAFIVIAVVYVNEGNILLTIFSRFVERGLDNTGRTDIWNSYIQSINSIPTLLLGSNLDQIPLIRLMGNNVHCAFLSCHAYYGIIAFGVIVIGTIKKLITLTKIRNYFCTLLLLCFVIRCLTDKVFLDDFAFGSFWLFFIFMWFDDYMIGKSRSR